MNRNSIQDRNMLADKASKCCSNRFIFLEVLAVRIMFFFFNESYFSIICGLGFQGLII